MVQMKWNANTILTFPIYRTGSSARRIILFGGKEEICLSTQNFKAER